MYYLVYPNGSRLFREPVPEDFAYHCLLLSIDKDLGLTAVKAPTLVGVLFFVQPFAPCILHPFPCQPVTSFFPCTFFRSGAGGFAGAPRCVFRRLTLGRLVSPTLLSKKLLTKSPLWLIMIAETKGR